MVQDASPPSLQVQTFCLSSIACNTLALLPYNSVCPPSPFTLYLSGTCMLKRGHNSCKALYGCVTWLQGCCPADRAWHQASSVQGHALAQQCHHHPRRAQIRYDRLSHRPPSGWSAPLGSPKLHTGRHGSWGRSDTSVVQGVCKPVMWRVPHCLHVY